MKIHELKDLTKEDLIQKEKALKKELFELNFHRKYGRVEKPVRFRSVKHTIAKIKTILNERDKNGSKK